MGKVRDFLKKTVLTAAIALSVAATSKSALSQTLPDTGSVKDSEPGIELKLKESRSEFGMPSYLVNRTYDDFKVEGNGVEFVHYPPYSMPGGIHNPVALGIYGSQLTPFEKRWYLSTQQAVYVAIPQFAQNVKAELQWIGRMRAMLGVDLGSVRLHAGPLIALSGFYEEYSHLYSDILKIGVNDNPIGFKEAGFTFGAEGKNFTFEGDMEYEKPSNVQGVSKLRLAKARLEAKALFGKNFVVLLNYSRNLGTVEQIEAEKFGIGLVYGNEKKKFSIAAHFLQERLFDHINRNDYSYVFSFTKGLGKNFYIGSTFDLQTIGGKFNPVYSLFWGLHYGEERNGKDGLKLSKGEALFPYLSMPVMNDAYLTGSRRILPFYGNSAMLSFLFSGPNSDSHNDSSYALNAPLRAANNVLAQTLGGNAFVPFGRKSIFGMGLSGYYANWSAQSREQEHYTMLEPYAVLRGNRIAGMLGAMFYPGYNYWGISPGISTPYLDIGAGFKFADGKLRVLDAMLNVRPTYRTAFSVFTSFDSRNNQMGYLIQRNKALVKVGMDIMLTNRMSFNSAATWSSNLKDWKNDPLNGMALHKKFGILFGFAHWLTPYLSWSPSIGVFEAKREIEPVFQNGVEAMLSIRYSPFWSGYFAKMKDGKAKKDGFPYYKFQSSVYPMNDAYSEFATLFGGNFLRYGLSTAGHKWDDALYKRPYRSIYLVERGGYDNIVHDFSGGALFNLGKSPVALGFSVENKKQYILSEKFSSWKFTVPKLLVRFGKSDAVFAPNFTVDNGRIDGWGLQWGVSFPAVQIANEVDFGNHGDVQDIKLWLTAYPRPWMAVTVLGEGNRDGEQHMQLGKVGAEFSPPFLNGKWFGVSLDGSFGIMHSEKPLGPYRAIDSSFSNVPQNLAEILHYSYEMGLTLRVGSFLYIHPSFFKEHWMSPPGPFLDGFKLGVEVHPFKKFGIGGGESGTDSKGHKPHTDAIEQGELPTKHYTADKLQMFNNLKSRVSAIDAAHKNGNAPYVKTAGGLLVRSRA